MTITPYIYGNLQGFQLYEGSTEDWKLFSTFYNGILAKERRMVVNRLANGKTYYNYLRYGTQECSTENSGGRMGGVFGMSFLLDSNCYIYDIAGLINRFDFLLEKIISRSILLKREKNNVIHFLVDDFAKIKGEMQSIKKDMESIIDKESIMQYDNNFVDGTSEVAIIADNIPNDKIIDIFKDYKNITIAKAYKIIYKVDGEIYGKVEQKFYNSIITPLPNPSKNGCEFSGWSAIPEKVPDSDVIIEGSFISHELYTIIYKVDGKEYGTQQLTDGAKIVCPEFPERDGYIFSGWNTAYDYMPKKNIVINGSFSKIEHKSTEKKNFGIKKGEDTKKGDTNKDNDENSGIPKIIVIIIIVVVLSILIGLLCKMYFHKGDANGNNTESTITESTALTNDKDSMLTEFQTFMKNNDIFNAYVVHKGKLEGKILKDTLLSQLTRIINKREENKCDIFFEKYKNYLNDKDILCVPPNEKIDNIKNLCKLIIKHKLIVNSDILYAMFYNADFFNAVMKDYKGKTK